MSITAFGVENLHCLTDTGLVPLRPLTLLVGKNSSGKSTFLRSFPLLRQSVEVGRKSPILWFDPRFVDFGSFADAVNFRAAERSITFRFRVRCGDGGWVIQGTPTFDIALTLAEGGAGLYVASYKILVEDHAVRMKCAPDGRLVQYEVNSHDFLPEGEPFVLGGRVVLLPTPRPTDGARAAYIAVAQKPRDDSSEAQWEGSAFADKLWQPAIDALHAALGSEPEIYHRIEDSIPIGSSTSMLATVKARLEAAGRGDIVADPSNPALRRALALRVASYMPIVLDYLDRAVADFASGITYIAPLRASAQRAYRIQEVAVDEVTARGENLAMFLHALSPEEIRSLAAFTARYLGFEVEVESARNHAEIRIKERGADRFVNLVDAGFGYAEILPLAAALWSACARAVGPGGRATTMVAMEQPELHLHPAYQPELAELLVGALDASRAAGREVSLMVETHSEALVNALGDLVEDGRLAAGDVQIVLFEQDPATRQTTLRFARYDDDGALRNWPHGFFAPVAENAFAFAVNE